MLGIKASGSETALIRDVPRKVKVSARGWIERVVSQGVSGVPLTWIPAPPSSISPRVGVLYFSVDRQHQLFEPLRKERTVGVYVPAEIQASEIDLHVVLENPA